MAVLVAVAAASGTSAVYLEEGRVAFVLGAASLVSFAGLATMLIRRFAPRLLLPIGLIALFAAQGFWVALLAILGLDTAAMGTTLPVDPVDQPGRALMPLFGAIVAVFVAAFVVALMSRRASGRAKATGILPQPSADADFLLMLAAPAVLLVWIGTMDVGVATAYACRVVGGALSFVPFVAGGYRFRNPLGKPIWWACLVMNVAIGIIAGTRSPLIPLVLFFAGRALWATPAERRVRAITLGGVVALGLLVGTIIGQMREVTGRDALTADRARSVLEYLGASQSGASLDRAGVGMHGLSRAVAWANFAVPLLTPDVVPYRESRDPLGEAAMALQVAAISGRSRTDLLGDGLYTAPANDYGFTVGESTSVEFGVLPDGYSRGGIALAFLFVLVVSGALLIAETVVLGREPAIAGILFAVLARSAYEVGNLPLYAVLRRVILDTALVAVLLVVARSVSTVLGVKRSNPTDG